jgi:predicted amidohydrolase
MKKREVIISVAQIKYFDISKKNNVEKIKKYIILAKKKSADIVCFPESCVYKTDTLRFDDKFLKEIKNECRKNSIWCIITEVFEIKKKDYKMAVLIDRTGKIVGKYKKINLNDDDTIPGKKTSVFKTDFGKIGIAICWDLAFPKLFRLMKQKGAEIVFCPSKWAYELQAHGARKYEEKHKKNELKILKSLLLSRAFENLFFVALCNPEGYDIDCVSYSAIASPHKILSSISEREGLITTKINLDEIKKLEKLYNK